MKTWMLVWFLVYPPSEGGTGVTWEYSQEVNLTRQKCFELLVDKDIELTQHTIDGKLVGHQVYCKEN